MPFDFCNARLVRRVVFPCFAMLGGLLAQAAFAQDAMVRLPGPLDGRILSVELDGRAAPLQLSERSLSDGEVEAQLTRIGILAGPDGPLKPLALYALDGPLPEGVARCQGGEAAFLALRRDKGSSALTALVFAARSKLELARGEGLCARLSLDSSLPANPARAEPDPVDVAMVSTMAELTPVVSRMEEGARVGAAPDPALKAGQLSQELVAALDPYRNKLSTLSQEEPEVMAALPPQTGAPQTPASQTPAPLADPQGAWQLFEGVDDRNRPQVALVLEAERTSGLGGAQAQLVARCMANVTALFAVWPNGFSGDARSEFLRSRDVGMQIDDTPVERAEWELWPAQNATYVEGFPGDLLRRLQRAEYLSLHTRTVTGAPIEAEFDLRGLSHHLAALAEPCHWSP